MEDSQEIECDRDLFEQTWCKFKVARPDYDLKNLVACRALEYNLFDDASALSSLEL